MEHTEQSLCLMSMERRYLQILAFNHILHKISNNRNTLNISL